MTNQPDLRHCPSCNGPVTGDLGLRDYASWLPPGTLPGKVSASDIDFFLEQSQTGRCLAMEFKAGNKPLGLGQRLLFKGLRGKGIDVWVVWERKDTLLAGEMDETGEVRFVQEMNYEELAKKVRAWWWDGLNDLAHTEAS